MINDLFDVQVIGSATLFLIYSLLLWRGWQAMAPSRKTHDLIRLRRLLVFAVLWLTTLALLVGALAIDSLLSIDLSRGIYAALRAVMFIVGLAMLLTWSPVGWLDSPPSDELRLRGGPEQHSRRVGDDPNAGER